MKLNTCIWKRNMMTDIADCLQNCVLSSNIFRTLLQLTHHSSALSQLALSQLLSRLEVSLSH